MENKKLSDEQLNQVSGVLKKYGIESQDLLYELTDHFGAEIEQEVENGASFDQAFGQFVSQNSWLKLRKLQFAHWKYSEQSLLQFVFKSLRELYSLPKVFLALSGGVLLYFVLSSESDGAHFGLLTLHAALVVQTIYIFVVAMIKSRKYKMVDVGYVAQTSMTVFYVMILPTWSDNWSLFAPAIPAELGIGVQWGYYFLVFHLAYLHLLIFQRGLAKINQREILG